MRTLLQIAVLFIASMAVGVGVNSLAPKPLPLLANADQFKIKHDGPDTPVSEIMKIWTEGTAIFLDARSEDEFKKGHIPGAQSAPYKTFEEGKIPEAVEMLRGTDQMLVIYCDGADCHASKVVYDKLLENGFSKEYMKVFEGGWKVWVEAKGEVEEGEADTGGGGNGG